MIALSQLFSPIAHESASRPNEEQFCPRRYIKSDGLNSWEFPSFERDVFAFCCERTGLNRVCASMCIWVLGRELWESKHSNKMGDQPMTLAKSRCTSTLDKNKRLECFALADCSLSRFCHWRALLGRFATSSSSKISHTDHISLDSMSVGCGVFSTYVCSSTLSYVREEYSEHACFVMFALAASSANLHHWLQILA